MGWATLLIPVVMLVYVGAILWGMWLFLYSNAMLFTGSGSSEDRNIALIMDVSLFGLWLIDRFRSAQLSKRKDLSR